MSQGRGPSDTVWRQAAISEGSNNMGLFYIAVLWDLLQFDEHVPWDLLESNSKLTNFPIVVLRMAAQTHQWPRYLQYDGMLMDPLDPQRGIVTGSASA
eukprot:4736833-Pyramimonas_sp.AAC.1